MNDQFDQPPVGGISARQKVIMGMLACVSIGLLVGVVLSVMKKASDDAPGSDRTQVASVDSGGTSSDSASRKIDQNSEVLLDEAQAAADQNKLADAKQLCMQAFGHAKSPEQMGKIRDLLDKIKSRQAFINKRFQENVERAKTAFEEGNLDRAKALLERFRSRKLATNYHFLRQLVARIDGFERGRLGLRDDGKTWADIEPIIRPSVVCIASEIKGKWYTASGFVVSGKLVVTNHHVVADGPTLANQVWFRFDNESRVRARSVVHIDEQTDLAILAVDKLPEYAKPLRLFAGQARSGEEVAAYGHPIGLDFTFTPGYVSSLREGADLPGTRKGSWVQHTAPISSGNSGGPLVDKDGNVVAVNSWRFMDHESLGGDVQNLNFAISVGDLRTALNALDPADEVELKEEDPSAANEPRDSQIDEIFNSFNES